MTTKHTLLIISIIGFLLLTPGCLKLEKKELQHAYQVGESVVDVSKPLQFGTVRSFENAYEGVRMIDDKYNIDFKKEALFGLMVNENLVPHVKRDLDGLRKKLDPEGTLNAEDFFNITPNERTQQQLGIIFIDARRKMIEAQELFHQGYSFGVQGLVGDGFYCREEPIIMLSIQAFNISAREAATAKYYLDELLTNTKDITWEFVGVKNEKPLFYYSPSEMMWTQLKINRRILTEYCHDEDKLRGKSVENVFVNFQGSGHKDLFITPSRNLLPKVWERITSPIQLSTRQIQLGAEESIE